MSNHTFVIQHIASYDANGRLIHNRGWKWGDDGASGAAESDRPVATYVVGDADKIRLHSLGASWE